MIRMITSILLLYFALQPLAYSKMYKWVDEEGVTQFSTFPPANVKKEYQTLSSKSHTKKPLSEYINGLWLYQENNKNYEMPINSLGISINEVTRNNKTNSTKLIMNASWTLSGKILDLKYKKHKNKKLEGTSETFFIVKIDDSELILINDKTNKRIRYRRKGYKKESLIEHSPLMQKLVGYWTGATEKHDIQFINNGTFIISGTLNRYWTKMYQGDWEYTDPQLLFKFTIDNAIPNGRMSKTGKTEKYRVQELTEDRLQIQSDKTGNVKTFLRKKTKKKSNKKKR